MEKLTFALGAIAALTAHGSEGAHAPAFSPNAAIAIVRPLYEALTASTSDEVRERLESATSPEWQNCGLNDACETRDATIARWSARIARLPDFRFEIREILLSGNRIIVRSQATGAPTEPFMGINAEGRSFAIMTLDVHEVEGGKIIRTFHVEDWGRASRQLRGEQ